MKNIVDAIGKYMDCVTKWIVSLMFKILKKDVSDETVNGLVQFIKFGIIGVSNTVISYVIYVVSLMLLKKAEFAQEYGYLIAQIIAFVLSVLWSFFWNNRMVFVEEDKGKRVWWKALIKTYISYSFTGLFLNSILLIVFVKWMGISEFVAPIINLLISVPVNFVINKFWAFSSK